MTDRGSGDEEEWEDDEDVHEIPSDDDLPPLLCFFCPHVTTRLIKAQHHMLQEHQFDLANTTAQFKISDDYEFIRFINFIRKEVDKGAGRSGKVEERRGGKRGTSL